MDTPDRYFSIETVASIVGCKSVVEFNNHSVPLDDPSVA